MSGLFITLEGIDGCGKSTQWEMLGTTLKERGVDVLLTRQPGGTTLGERIRAILLSKENTHLSFEAELLLMMADRAQHCSEVIRPALEAGKIVVSDRYIDSSVAFQGYGRGLDINLVHQLNRFATGGLMPDLTIIFDLDPAIASKRLASRKPVNQRDKDMTRIDDEDLDFHHRVRAAYREISAQAPDRVTIVDASGSAEETARNAQEIVLSLIESHR